MAVKKSSQKEIERAVKRRPAGIYQLPKAFGQELDMRRGNVLGKKVRLQMLRDSRKKNEKCEKFKDDGAKEKMKIEWPRSVGFFHRESWSEKVLLHLLVLHHLVPPPFPLYCASVVVLC